MNKEDKDDKKPLGLDKKGIQAGNHVTIKTIIYADLVEDIDEFARQYGISRSDAIAIAISEYLKRSRQ